MKKSNSKRTFGQELIERLQEFVETLESGADIEKTFRCHRVEVDGESPPAAPQVVKQTRKMVGASQAAFAQFLGVSAQTLREWEQGANEPGDIAKRFMDEIRLNPDYWRGRLAQVAVAKKRRAKSTAK